MQTFIRRGAVVVLAALFAASATLMGQTVVTRLASLMVAGATTSGGVVSVTGNTGLGPAGAGFQFASFGSPDIGRIFIGDGTGYRMHIASRVGSVTTDRFTFFDNGNLTVTGAPTFNGAATFSGGGLFSDGGAVSTPGVAFASETDSGLWRENAGQWSLVANGVRALRITESAGNITFDTSSGSGKWSSALMPSATATYDLGRTDLRWNSAWVTAGAFNSSDARLKTHIVPTSLGLEFVRGLKPVEYDWKNPRITGHYYGFLAQDLLAQGFKAVDTSNPDEYALRYTDLLAPMAKAIQELDAEVTDLRAKVARLERRR